MPSFGLPWRSDRPFCVCAWNWGEGSRIALWDFLWTNLDPLSLSTFQQPKEKYYSRCWNPPSPVTQFTLFLALPPSLTFCGPPPPSFARFCLIHAFLVLERYEILQIYYLTAWEFHPPLRFVMRFQPSRWIWRLINFSRWRDALKWSNNFIHNKLISTDLFVIQVFHWKVDRF